MEPRPRERCELSHVHELICWPLGRARVAAAVAARAVLAANLGSALAHVVEARGAADRELVARSEDEQARQLTTALQLLALPAHVPFEDGGHPGGHLRRRINLVLPPDGRHWSR